MLNRVQIWLTLLCFLAFNLPGEAQLKKKPQNLIPPNLAKAWTDAGAEMGWMYDDDGIPRLAHGDVTSGVMHYLRIVTYKEGEIAKLPAPPVPFGLYAFNAKLTDAGLKELAHLQKVETLTISGNPITEDGLGELLALKSLRLLSLNEMKITDKGLETVVKIESLEALFVSSTAVTDAGLNKLIGLKKLRWLGLDQTKIGDEGIKILAKIESLERLNLVGTKVTDAGVKTLSACKKLKVLTLQSTAITDACVPDLATLKSLRTLSVPNTKITNEGAKRLQMALPDTHLLH
jgi:hypothetical protein